MAYGKKKDKDGEVRDHYTPILDWWYNDLDYMKLQGGGGNGKPTGNDMSTRGGGTAGVQLAVGTPDGNYVCQSVKPYTEKASIIQDVDTTDSFITLSSFSKNLAALTVHTAKVIVIKNVGITALEILIEMPDWRDDSDGTDIDVANSVDMNAEGGDSGQATVYRHQTFLLPVGEFIYLPTSRFISYSPHLITTLESSCNAVPGQVAIETKDINSGNEFKKVATFSGTTYASGSDVLIDGTVSSTTSTSLVVDDGDWFEVGDLLILGNSQNEVVEVESISGTTLTIKRGLLGTTAAAITNNHEINYFFGNENLAYNNGKCQTDQNGNFSQRGAFFGYGRTADKKIKGVVAGSVAIGPFYGNAHLDFGLQNIKASDKTGLVASTTYTFTIVVDEFHVDGFNAVSSETNIAFTTDASDTTWAGSGNAVLPKIQAIFDEQFYTTSSGLAGKKVTIGLHNGDVRITSHSHHSETRVGIGNVTGTTPFGVGRFPAKDGNNVPVVLGTLVGTTDDNTDCISYGAASILQKETIEDPVTGKEIQNTSAFLIDDGNGNLRHNGSVVGSIDYAKGHCAFTHLPNAEFKIYAQTLSAHSGGVTYLANGMNSIQKIAGRSVNAKQDGKVELLLLG